MPHRCKRPTPATMAGFKFQNSLITSFTTSPCQISAFNFYFRQLKWFLRPARKCSSLFSGAISFIFPPENASFNVYHLIYITYCTYKKRICQYYRSSVEKNTTALLYWCCRYFPSISCTQFSMSSAILSQEEGLIPAVMPTESRSFFPGFLPFPLTVVVCSP